MTDDLALGSTDLAKAVHHDFPVNPLIGFRFDFREAPPGSDPFYWEKRVLELGMRWNEHASKRAMFSFGPSAFQEARQPADHGMAEADGSAVITHNPQSGRQFSKRSPPGQGLHGNRDNHEAEHDADQHQGAGGGVIEFPAGGGDTYQRQCQQHDVDRDIEQEAQGTGRERCRTQFQDNGLACD